MTTSRIRGRLGAAAIAAATAAALGLVATPAAQAEPAPAQWSGAHRGPGHDYYVDAADGSDAAKGTGPATAWRSLAKVSATTFRPGDRILLKAGSTWSDQRLWPKGSGSKGRPITIDAYGPKRDGRPSIATNGHVPSPFTTGTTKNPRTVGLTGAVNLRNQQYWTIQHLDLSNDDDPSTDIVKGHQVRDGISVSVNADLLPATGGAATVMHGITVRDNTVHDLDGPNSWQKIYAAGVDFQVFGSKQYGEYGRNGYAFQGARVEGNSFHHVELNAVQFGFNWMGDSVGQKDATGKFHEGWEQLWVRTRNLYSHDVRIAHNYAEDIGQGAYQFGDIDHLVAEYNEANGWLQRYDGVSAGLYLWCGSNSVMRFNEVYGGPPAEFDATPWDLEYTNFHVTYERNYSHDNQGGWMSYMGNSDRSIARYNLSVNDAGVLWKNMLSTNYSPTYVTNNVFVYDGARIDSFHDQVLKDTVYFTDNVFMNTSKTATTTWAAKPGGLDRGVFAGNAFSEASGAYAVDEPRGEGAVQGDPGFVGAPTVSRVGVDDIRKAGNAFRLRPDSPLVDAGRYTSAAGTKDWFGKPAYRGKAPDIGIVEVQRGKVVRHPKDRDPIEDAVREPRDLARGATATATSSNENPIYGPASLTDGTRGTRWAAGDDTTAPITIGLTLKRPTRFDQVVIDEYFDGGTPRRVQAFDLQRWDGGAWRTFASGTGIGADRRIDGFGTVTASKLRLVITKASGSPTLNDLRLHRT